VSNLLSFGAENLSSILKSQNTNLDINGTVISPCFLVGFEALSVTLKGDCRLRLCKNRELSRILECNRGVEKTNDEDTNGL
jgi:hypothetical protein